MAWLQATPKPDPRRFPNGKVPPTLKLVSRHERMKSDGITPQMPPNPAPHIIDRLIEIGLTEAAGMAAGPLSWQEIDAWCNRTGVDLPPWEARLIRRLSSEYLSESRKAEDENCPPPWRAPVTQRERDVEMERLVMVLG